VFKSLRGAQWESPRAPNGSLQERLVGVPPSVQWESSGTPTGSHQGRLMGDARGARWMAPGSLQGFTMGAARESPGAPSGSPQGCLMGVPGSEEHIQIVGLRPLLPHGRQLVTPSKRIKQIIILPCCSFRKQKAKLAVHFFKIEQISRTHSIFTNTGKTGNEQSVSLGLTLTSFSDPYRSRCG